jgi:transposase-like protein
LLHLNPATLRNWVVERRERTWVPAAGARSVGSAEVQEFKKRVTELERAKEILTPASALREIRDSSSIVCISAAP